MNSSLAASRTIDVAVLELVTAGYFGGDIDESFRREGRAMLDAVCDDFQRIANVNVVVPRAVARRDGTLLRSIADSRADYSLIIAPEFDGLLEQFCAAARKSGARSLNCEPAVLAIGADKWAFTRHLQQHALPGVPTRLSSLSEPPLEFPCVIKPRYGAGSWLVRRLCDADEFSAIADDYRTAGLAECLCQPAVLGKPCSVAALVRSGSPPEILPVAEQHLSSDGAFRYLGGRIPADLPEKTARKIQSLTVELVASLPGLNGYIGVDLIVPDDGEPLFVELNPRLTTSYIGYRQLCEENLMERLLFPQRAPEPLRWKPGGVTFDSADSGLWTLDSRLSTLDS